MKIWRNILNNSLLIFAASFMISFHANAQGLPTCEKTDKRIGVISWQPSFNSDGTLNKEPPTGEGIIVYIRTSVESVDLGCGYDGSDVFSIEYLYGHDRELGGLSVNFPSSAVSYVQGLCNISGFFMNRDVPGLHGGFSEIYFEPVDIQKIVLSKNFCMKR